MNIETFLAHHHIGENPFGAEEARHDPVFQRLIEQGQSHPDFAKVLGQIDRPGTSVVFGEKGSGKTAIRLMISSQVAEHNANHPDKRVMVVAYDDLNPVFDNLLRANGQDAEAVLNGLRLEDHQDAILSLAVTRLTDALLGVEPSEGEATPLPKDLKKRLRHMPRQSRLDLAVLAALYDQPQTGSVVNRWRRLRRKLRLGWVEPVPWLWVGASVMTLAVAGFGFTQWWMGDSDDKPIWLLPALGMSLAGAVLLWIAWAWQAYKRWSLCRRIHKQMPAVNRSAAQLREMFEDLGGSNLSGQPLPTDNADASALDNAGSDSRYQLTRRLIEVLSPLGYAGMIVLVDRVDEPTLIHGRADRMKAVVWPMLDNKFLQQKGVGIKLLLPIELRHHVHRESPKFFEEARLDKQNLVDRLAWSGSTLYDLCTRRLRACQSQDAAAEDTSDSMRDTQASEAEAQKSGVPRKPIQMMDLFQPDVSRDAVIDALDQMQQPRDAFKFVYELIQEHCRLSPEDQPSFRIARITLDNVRRAQAQRVLDLHRGLSPA